MTDGTNYVKIGYASDFEKRIKTLQNANPRNLYCLLGISGDIEIEHLLHDYFKDYRIRLDNIDTCEWFFISGELKKFLDISSVQETEDYLYYHFPKRRWRVIFKKENVENELYFYKTQSRKQNELIKKLEKRVERQKTQIKRLNTSVQKLKEKDKNENVENKRRNERILSLQSNVNGNCK